MTPLDAFALLDLRVGRIVRAEPHEKARKPSCKLWIDFGQLAGASHPIGIRQSSARVTDLYSTEELIGRLVIAAVNLGVRNIAGFESQVLVLGVPDEAGRVVLLQPQREVPLGGRVF
jgi:tRNA-binding protein